MSGKESNILNKLYFISGCMFVFALMVVFKLTKIQFVEGESYRALAEKRTLKDVIIPANRGNVYSLHGNLLATSVPKYDIRIDLLASSSRDFESYIGGLCDSISNFYNNSSQDLQQRIRKARANKNRYFLLARNLGYSDYLNFRSFPLLNLGAYKGGLIVDQKTKRDYPLGAIAQRSIGYERTDDDGFITRVGIDGAFGKDNRGVGMERGQRRALGKEKGSQMKTLNKMSPKKDTKVKRTWKAKFKTIPTQRL